MTETIPQAYFVPGVEVEEQAVEFNGVPLRVPLDTRRVHPIAAGLRYKATLRQMPLADIVDALGETTRRWQLSTYAFRQVAEEYLPRLTGYSRPVIARGLDHLFRELRHDNLWALLEEEFDDPLVLDEWRPRRRAKGKVRAFGPRLTLHIIAGNIPGLGVQSLVFALLVKSPSVVKSATDEPLLTALFAQSLNEVCPELARNVAVMWWAGEKTVRLPVQFADAVIAYGSSETMEMFRGTLPARSRFIGYGHRYSIALVARECATPKTTHMLATDMAMYDQQGCLSPQLCWVEEGGTLSPQEFAQRLGNALETIETKLPSGTFTAERMANIQQVRATFEIEEEYTLYVSPRSTRWTVAFTTVPTRGLPQVPRGVLVLPRADLLQPIAPTLSVVPNVLCDEVQAIGIAAPPERAQAIIDAYAAETGVNRFCPIGKMQFPPLLWHHDGRPNLTDLVRWVDVEF